MTRSSSTTVHRKARLTSLTVGAVAGSLVAGGFELSRALSGNTLSWVYTFEWPLIAGYVIYIRHKLLKEVATEGPDRSRASTAPSEAQVPGTSRGDPELVAWREYLDRLHTVSPPGGPPPDASPPYGRPPDDPVG